MFITYIGKLTDVSEQDFIKDLMDVNILVEQNWFFFYFVKVSWIKVILQLTVKC